MGRRAELLAERLERGASALAALADSMTDEEWRKSVPPDGRPAGVIVHHVASVYPLEIKLARLLAMGQPITGVTKEVVDRMNADHAREHASVTKAEALELLRRNSADAAAAVRALSDDELDRAAPVSLNFDAPLTCQFFIEDHALQHSYHHLARISAALGRP
ncbi:MAG TPA: DinB family protein [Gemmatimonadales bacterium]|nr:DinB family protein [Gemmatimonadales bacterium]